jgi:hypothetical protein
LEARVVKVSGELVGLLASSSASSFASVSCVCNCSITVGLTALAFA